MPCFNKCPLRFALLHPRQCWIVGAIAKNTLDCKTVVFFLKISKEVGKAWRKSLTRAKLASLTRPERLSSVSLSVLSLVPDLSFDCSLLEHAKIRTVLQSANTWVNVVCGLDKWLGMSTLQTDYKCKFVVRLWSITVVFPTLAYLKYGLGQT